MNDFPLRGIQPSYHTHIGIIAIGEQNAAEAAELIDGVLMAATGRLGEHRLVTFAIDGSEVGLLHLARCLLVHQLVREGFQVARRCTVERLMYQLGLSGVVWCGVARHTG